MSAEPAALAGAPHETALDELENRVRPALQSDSALKRLSALDQLETMVHGLWQRAEALDCLAGEMLATMRIPGNGSAFAALPPEWHRLVDSWERRFREIRGIRP